MLPVGKGQGTIFCVLLSRWIIHFFFKKKSILRVLGKDVHVAVDNFGESVISFSSL